MEISVNGTAVYRCHLVLPKVGRWWAELEIEQKDNLTLSSGQSLTLTIASDGVTKSFQGVIDHNRSGIYLSSYKVRMVAGAGGWLTEIGPFGYGAGHTVRDIATALLGAAGERLSSTSGPVIGVGFGAYSAIQGPLASCMGVLTDLLGNVSARFLPDGTFWIGSDTFTPSTVDYTIQALQPDRNAAQIELVGPLLSPGESITEGRVNYIEYFIDHQGCKANVLFEDG